MKHVEQIILILKFVQLWIDTYSCVCMIGVESLLADTYMHTHTCTQSCTHLLPWAFLFSTSTVLLKLWSHHSPLLPQWVLRPAIHLSCIWVALWRPLNVCENLDFNKDQPWLPAAGARSSMPPYPPWLVSQILMSHFHTLGSEWPLLIKTWIYSFTCISGFRMGRSASPAECNFRLGKIGADFMQISLKSQNVLKP